MSTTHRPTSHAKYELRSRYKGRNEFEQNSIFDCYAERVWPLRKTPPQMAWYVTGISGRLQCFTAVANFETKWAFTDDPNGETWRTETWAYLPTRLTTCDGLCDWYYEPAPTLLPRVCSSYLGTLPVGEVPKKSKGFDLVYRTIAGKLVDVEGDDWWPTEDEFDQAGCP